MNDIARRLRARADKWHEKNRGKITPDVQLLNDAAEWILEFEASIDDLCELIVALDYPIARTCCQLSVQDKLRRITDFMDGAGLEHSCFHQIVK